MAMDSLVSCSDVVKIWDTGGWKLGQSTTMTMQNAVTNSCCWVSNGQAVVTAGSSGFITVVKPSGIIVPTKMSSAHDLPINAVAVSPGARKLATAGDAGEIEIWSTKSKGKMKADTLKQGSPVTCISFLDSESHLAAGDSDGRVLLHHLKDAADDNAHESPSPVSLPPVGAHSGVLDLSVRSAAATMVGVAHSDGAVRLWETGREGNCIREMKGQHRGAATGIDFSPNGHNLFATVGADGRVRYIDIRVGEKSGRVLRSMEAKVPLTCLSFHNELHPRLPCARAMEQGHVLSVGASDGTIRLIDLRTASQVGTPKVAYAGPSPPPGGVREVAFQRPSPCIGIGISSSSSCNSSSCSSNGATSPRGLGVTESWVSSSGNRTGRPGVRPVWEPEMVRGGTDVAPAARPGRSKPRPGDGVDEGERGPSGYSDDAANAPPSMVEAQPRRRRLSGKGLRADSALLPPAPSGGLDGSVNRPSASRRAGRGNSHDPVAAGIGQRGKAVASTTARQSSEQQRTVREEGVNKDARRRRRETPALEEGGTRSQRAGRRDSTVGRFANAPPEHRPLPSPKHHVVPEHADKTDQRGQRGGDFSDDRGVVADEEGRWSHSRPSLQSSTSGRNVHGREGQQPPPDHQPSEPASASLYVEPRPHSRRPLQQQQQPSNGHESVTLSTLEEGQSARVGVNRGGGHRHSHPDGLGLSRPSLRSSNSERNKDSPPSPPHRGRSEADVPSSTPLSSQREPSSPPSRRRRQQQQQQQRNDGYDSAETGIDRGGRDHASHHDGLNRSRSALRSSTSGRNASWSDRQQQPYPPNRRRSEADGSLPTSASFQAELSPHYRRQRQHEKRSDGHGGATLSTLQEGQGARIGNDQGGHHHEPYRDTGNLSRPSVRSSTSSKNNQPPSPLNRWQSDANGPLPTSPSLHAERSVPPDRRQQQQQQYQQPNKYTSVKVSMPQVGQIAGAGVDRGDHRDEAQPDDLSLSRPSLHSPQIYEGNSQLPPPPPGRRRSEANSSLQMPPSLDVEPSSRRLRKQELEQQANHGHESVLLSPPHVGHSAKAVVDGGLDDSFFPLNDDEGSGANGDGDGAKRLTSPGHSRANQLGLSPSLAPSSRAPRSTSWRQAGDEAEVKAKSSAASTREAGGTDTRSSGLDRAMLEQMVSSQGAMMDQMLSSQRTMMEEVFSSQISILRKELRQEFRNVHVDMLRQFQSHQDEQALAMANIEERLGCLIAENMALRAENTKLRNVF